MINLNPSFKKIDLKSKVKIDDGKISFSVISRRINPGFSPSGNRPEL